MNRREIKEHLKKRGLSEESAHRVLENVSFKEMPLNDRELLFEVTTQCLEKSLKKCEEIKGSSDLGVSEKIVLMAQSLQVIDHHKEEVMNLLDDEALVSLQMRVISRCMLRISTLFEEVIDEGIEKGLLKAKYPKETILIMIIGIIFSMNQEFFPFNQKQNERMSFAFNELFIQAFQAKESFFDGIGRIIY